MESYFYCHPTSASNYFVLRAMQERGELCDAVLEIDSGEKIRAHKCILSAASPYFRAMFNTPLSECQQGMVKLRDMDREILQAVISYVYCSDVCLPSDQVLSLLMVADRFQMDCLVEECSQFLETQINANNVLNLRAYSNLHQCWKLFKRCTQYVLDNFKEVSESDDFLSLPSDQLKDLLTDNSLSVNSEEDVYFAVLRWTYYAKEDRKTMFPSIISCVHLPFVSMSFLRSTVQHEELMQQELCQQFISEAFFYKSSPEKRVQLKQSPRAHPRKVYGLQEVILVIGGLNKDNSVHTIDQYDVITDTWTTLSDLGTTMYGLASCFCNGNLYISGGYSTGQDYSNLVSCYNLKDHKWTSVAPMQTSRRYHCMVTMYGLMYVLGGQNEQGVLSQVEYYNPSTSQWSYLQSMTSPRMYHGVAEIDGLIFAIGGHNGVQRLTSVECYNPLLGTWKYAMSLPEPRSVMGVATLDGLVYVAGGYNGRQYLHSVLTYNVKLDKWFSIPSMKVARSAFGLVSYNGSLYALGGFCGSLLNSMEHFTPGDEQWYTDVAMTTERIHFSTVTT